jgi:subfamily B ATP-binding cassette protein HlyB/CyaB
MIKTDPQLKSNDGGISAVKTIFNIFGKNVDRKYLENNIPLEQKGSRITDLKDFLNSHGFIAEYKLLDINYIQGNTQTLRDLFPFIMPVHNKSGLHYVVVNDIKRNRLKIFDPAKGSQYFLSLQEVKKRAQFNKSDWELAQDEEKLIAICSKDLEEYNINIADALTENDYATLFNKLTYFTYIKENFGFKEASAEKDFLIDLLKNQDISVLPKHFKTLKYEADKIKITAPLILTVKPTKEASTVQLPEGKRRNLYWELFKQLGQFRQLWYIYIFAALFSASTAQLGIFTNQILIDNILPSYNLGTLTLFAIGFFIYKVFDLGTTLYKSFVGIHLGNTLDRYFLQSFDQKINDFSLPYIHSYKKGDLIERISDALKLKTFFLKYFTSFMVDGAVSIYSLGILFYINWALTLIVIGVMIMFYFWYSFITPKLKQNERLRYIRKSDFLSKMIEKIEGIQVIKSFRTEQHHSNKISASINEYLKIQLRNGYIDLVNKLVVAGIILVSSTLILSFLTKVAIVEQVVTLGQIVTFIALSTKIFSTLKSILDDNLTLQENEVILRRFMDFDEEEKERPQVRMEQFTIDMLEVHKLNFGYQTGEMILKDIDFVISRGEKVNIEGQNGSGKSTLSKILTALYEPASGTMLINGTDKKFFNSDAIKDKILLVSNEDILFNDTLEGNICLGKDIPVDKILELARMINFYDFIAAKDDGLDFLISENGKNLSTGQRKKILMMRALFATAEIIILDEVLSGMDIESRNKVETVINETNDRAFIIISHEPIRHIHFSKKYKIKNGQLNIIQDTVDQVH